MMRVRNTLLEKEMAMNKSSPRHCGLALHRQHECYLQHYG